MNQWEREEEQLGRDYESGLITSAEYNAQMRELQRDYAASAREAAENAYDNELERW